MPTRALVITCVGPDRAGLVGDLTGVIAEAGGNILDSRMALLGGEFAIIMLADVSAEGHEHLQAELQRHAAAEGLVIGLRDTSRTTTAAPGRSYRVRADTMDHPGIVQQVAAFFASHQCNIADL